MRRNGMDFGLPTFVEPRTALLFAQCMSEKIPKTMEERKEAEGRKDGDGGRKVPSEVRRWSEFVGGHP